MTLQQGYNLVTEPVADTDGEMTSLLPFHKLADYEEVSKTFMLTGLDESVCNADEDEPGGHHSWTKRGATKKISHGGLSLPECMTPVLQIQTN